MDLCELRQNRIQRTPSLKHIDDCLLSKQGTPRALHFFEYSFAVFLGLLSRVWTVPAFGLGEFLLGLLELDFGLLELDFGTLELLLGFSELQLEAVDRAFRQRRPNLGRRVWQGSPTSRVARSQRRTGRSRCAPIDERRVGEVGSLGFLGAVLSVGLGSLLWHESGITQERGNTGEREEERREGEGEERREGGLVKMKMGGNVSDCWLRFAAGCSLTKKCPPTPTASLAFATKAQNAT